MGLVLVVVRLFTPGVNLPDTMPAERQEMARGLPAVAVLLGGPGFLVA